MREKMRKVIIGSMVTVALLIGVSIVSPSALGSSSNVSAAGCTTNRYMVVWGTSGIYDAELGPPGQYTGYYKYYGQIVTGPHGGKGQYWTYVDFWGYSWRFVMNSASLQYQYCY